MPIPFSLPRFYPILDTAVSAEHKCSVAITAHVLIDAGVKILQYRHKEDWKQAHFDEAAEVGSLCHNSGVLFVINDRADFAHLLGAALHVGQNDLPPVAARKIIKDAVLGFSTHNRLQLTRADEEPVQYLALGPIFATNSKLKPDPVVGIEGLRKLRPLTKKPLVAIGGITLANAKEALDSGADSVAVIGAIFPSSCDRDSLRRRADTWLELAG